MASLTDILTTLQNGVVALQSVAKHTGLIFPQATATSTTTTTVFTSTSPSLFMTVQTSTGGQYIVPLYPK